jgi:hypothetical protein
MSDRIRKQIYDTLNRKETDELVEIWQANNRVEWTDTAFDIIREILQERLNELPTQDEPVLESVEIESNDEVYEVDEELAGQDDTQPVFYKPTEVLWLEKWLYRAAIAAVIAVCVTTLLQLPNVQRTWSYPDSGGIGSWIIAIVYSVLNAAWQSTLTYFPLKALGSILKILMEMEFNSRGV